MSIPIIDETPVELVEADLKHHAQVLRRTCRGGNELYLLTAAEAPNAMREIGRLREITFRFAGGGTGKECDIDEFDTMTPPCGQLVVWDPEDRQILGGYRYIFGADVTVLPDGSPRIATGHMFHFSERFLRDYLPYTIELGRSFVRIESQATGSASLGRKSIYVLDNLWDGLGALTVEIPQARYFFGKMTMYGNYLSNCRNMILHFINKHFPDPDSLVRPLEPLATDADPVALQQMYAESDGSFREDYRILNAAVRQHGLNIPPLINAYMSLSPTMRCLGTAINHEFGQVEETGILLTIDDIFEEKKQRHIASYVASHTDPIPPCLQQL
jgi:hypothetical protein